MNTNPKISIVIPTYNVEPYIERCIYSLKGQTSQNFEVIFVDDCGIDESISKAKKWAERDTRVKVVGHTKNLGTFHARKTGVAQANSKYILFLDPDDELELNAIEKIINHLHQEPDILFFGSKRVPRPKWWQSGPKVPTVSISDNKSEILNKVFTCKDLSYATEGKVIKKTILIKAYEGFNCIDGVRLIYGEDVLLFFGILLNIESSTSFHEALYIYHKNETSITTAQANSALNLNIDQLGIVIDIIKKTATNCDYESQIKYQIYSSLEFDRQRILIRAAEDRCEIISLYLSLFLKSKDPRVLFRFILYIFSIGKVKL